MVFTAPLFNLYKFFLPLRPSFKTFLPLTINFLLLSFKLYIPCNCLFIPLLTYFYYYYIYLKPL